MWVEELGLAAARSAIAIVAEVVTCLRYSRCVGGRLPEGTHIGPFSLTQKGACNVENTYALRRNRAGGSSTKDK